MDVHHTISVKGGCVGCVDQMRPSVSVGILQEHAPSAMTNLDWDMNAEDYIAHAVGICFLRARMVTLRGHPVSANQRHRNEKLKAPQDPYRNQQGWMVKWNTRKQEISAECTLVTDVAAGSALTAEQMRVLQAQQRAALRMTKTQKKGNRKEQHLT